MTDREYQQHLEKEIESLTRRLDRLEEACCRALGQSYFKDAREILERAFFSDTQSDTQQPR